MNRCFNRNGKFDRYGLRSLTDNKTEEAALNKHNISIMEEVRGGNPLRPPNNHNYMDYITRYESPLGGITLAADCCRDVS